MTSLPQQEVLTNPTAWSKHDRNVSTRGEIPEGFDPYRAWLNVQVVHRPLTAYQLLGLKPLEDDEQTIRAAVASQRMSIQSHRSEAAPPIWEQVRNELEDAVGVLLDPDRKATYDAKLEEERDAEQAQQGSPTAITGNVSPASFCCKHCGADLFGHGALLRQLWREPLGTLFRLRHAESKR